MSSLPVHGEEGPLENALHGASGTHVWKGYQAETLTVETLAAFYQREVAS